MFQKTFKQTSKAGWSALFFHEQKLKRNTFVALLLCIKLHPGCERLHSALLLSELEVQQQRLQEGSKVSSFCGPDTESHTHLDCISVPAQKIQDLHSNGIVWHEHQSSASVSSVRNHLFRVNSSDWILGTMQRNRFVNVRHVFTYLLPQGPTVKCRGGALFCNNTSQWTLSDPFLKSISPRTVFFGCMMWD